MAFWGVEVRPGRPFTHVFDPSKGRLRLCHATLGNGSAVSPATRILLQCNIEKASPILLCSLWPDKPDSCPLNMEFEETQQVIFSVVGPRSIHLTGCYLRNSLPLCAADNTESYGEDIRCSESKESNCATEDDDYEDSFINDEDPEVFPSSPESSKDKQTTRGKPRRLRKKCRPVESDGSSFQSAGAVKGNADAIASVDDDEEKFIDAPEGKNGTRRTVGRIIISDGSDEDDMIFEGNPDGVTALNKNIDTPVRDSRPKSDGQTFEVDDEDKLPISSIFKRKAGIIVGTNKQSDASKKADLVLDDNNGDAIASKEDSHVPVLGTVESSGGKEFEKKDGDKHENRQKPERKIQLDVTKKADVLENATYISEAKRKAGEHVAGTDPGSIWNMSKQKKRKKEHVKNGKALEAGHVAKDTEENNNNGSLKPKKRSKERLKEAQTLVVDHDNAFKDEKACEDVAQAEGTVRYPLVKQAQGQSLANDSALDMNPDQPAKSKKKKNAKKEEEILKTPESMNMDVHLHPKKRKANSIGQGTNPKANSSESFKVRTLSSGMTIEEKDLGDADGNLATLGKKVYVNYIARLKENNEIVRSNIDKAPYKFRLGGKKVIQGWNIGVDGMRVGGKRTLEVPPALAYGSEGKGSKIPPEAWLVYDIELVEVK